MTILYRTQATAIGGRTGSVASSDGALRLGLATPSELGGQCGQGTNPEQLFAAGYAACFLDSLRTVANDGNRGLADDANVTATVGLGTRADGHGLDLAIALDVDLPGFTEKEAEALTMQAHAICPYSNAVRGNVEVRFTIQ